MPNSWVFSLSFEFFLEFLKGFAWVLASIHIFKINCAFLIFSIVFSFKSTGKETFHSNIHFNFSTLKCRKFEFCSWVLSFFSLSFFFDGQKTSLHYSKPWPKVRCFRLDLTSRMVPQIKFIAWLAANNEYVRSEDITTIDVDLEDRALVREHTTQGEKPFFSSRAGLLYTM